MDTQNMIELLENMLNRLRALQTDRKSETRRELTRSFMGFLFQLGLEVHQNESLRSSHEMAYFIQESVILLPKVSNDIVLFAFATSNMFFDIWGPDDWERVCKRRSSIEFLRELYQNTSYTYAQEVDTNEVDQLLSEKGRHEGYLSPEVIPLGIPTSHWWWWYPNSPTER